MRSRPRPAVLLATAVTAGLLAGAPAALAAPAAPAGPAAAPAATDQERRVPAGREQGLARILDRDATAAVDGAGAGGVRARDLGARASGSNREVGDQAGYPRRTQLRVYPEDTEDAALRLGLIPYHAVAPALNALQERSDRVSVEVIGQSALGRDLYLVTVTAPEDPPEAARQEQLRRTISTDPVAAAAAEELRAAYKAPVFVNANIHGNEWEGTDAALRVVEELATSEDPAVTELLAHSRLYVNVTANPDGRVAGTRRNARDFDLNRDFITASQPETRAMRDALIGTQPLVMLDEHGYVNGTLIEPTTAPHGQNYEYDLYIRHALPNALGMEAAVQALGYTPEDDGVEPPVIPFRDYAPGDWDDWPPIFTPMYAMYHGAIGHTIEFPLRVNGSAYDELPVEELRRRSAVNTDIAAATIRAAATYAVESRAELVADQIELFRRGAAGEPRREVPLGFVPGWGPEDQGYTTEFPRAYVLPAQGRQRSAPAMARLVDHLVANDVEVLRADRPFRLGGRDYGTGSYVVDMHQPKRGLANVMLEAGRDISERVPQMYDISGWSHRLLWGATVHVVADGSLDVPGSPVVAAAPTGGVEVAPGGDLLVRLDDERDVAAVNYLLGLGLTLGRTDDGQVVVPAAARADALVAADRFGVRLRAAPDGVASEALQRLTLAAAVAGDELYALREMGFDVRPVSAEILDAGFDWTGVDVLVVSSGLALADLGEPARTALEGFLADGALVTRGSTGAALNSDAGLLPVTAVAGRRDANGVVRVRNARGPLTARPLPHSFVYSPVWFTELGEGVVAEQHYAGGDLLVAGHWRAEEDGTGGPAAAAGQASVVRGRTGTGAAVAMFGTEPLFRAHPKGLFAQVARAVYWTAGTAGTLPAATGVSDASTLSRVSGGASAG